MDDELKDAYDHSINFEKKEHEDFVLWMRDRVDKMLDQLLMLKHMLDGEIITREEEE